MNLTDKLAKLLWLGAHANILVICATLCGSLYIQFAMNEYPCPLCMVQRMSMMLCAVGQAYILCRISPEGTLRLKDFMVGHSMTAFSALAGSLMSIRQILLHIMPGDPGYGSAIFGLHLYTWGLIVFFCELLAVAINLLLAPSALETVSLTGRKLTRITLSFFALLLLTIAVATFVEEGFHWVLPDDPVRNELFYDLNLIKE